MSTTISFRVTGPTSALSVAATQHAAVAILDAVNENSNYAAFYNSGTTQVCVVMAALPATGTAATPTLVFPVDGTATVPNSFMLPASMTQPLVVNTPTTNGGFSVSAIGSAAGPSIIYITPVIPVG